MALRVIAFVAIALALSPASAQTPPDAGRILQDTRPAERPPPVSVPPIEAPSQPRPTVPAGAGDVRVNVTQFEFTGNHALSTETLRAAVAAWAGRSLTFGDLIQAVEAIEARYKQAGYFLAQAYLPPQKIRDGAIEIAISEGLLGETRLEGESHVAADVVFGYLDRLPKGEPLTLPILERQILLINELAGGHAALDLQAGEKPGSTDVVLTQQPDDVFSGRLEANNQGAPSTGEKRYGITLNSGSYFNLGERISFNALTSENRDLVSYNLRGELPVGGDGWKLTAAASRAEYSLGGAFADFKASGTADSLRAGASYPLIRSRANNVRVQVEADQSRLVDRCASAPEANKHSSGLTATASGDWLDDFMGGGSTRADLAARAGNVSDSDVIECTPRAAGHFTKTTLNAQRQQNVTHDVSLQLQLTYQLASKNLDSSEKMSLGGAASMPGYANGEASGDSGLQGRIGARWQATPEVALTAFTDYARLRLAHDPVPGTTKNDKRLTDAGLMADVAIGKNVTASFILAWAGKEAPNPADNDKPRFWFSLGYAW